MALETEHTYTVQLNSWTVCTDPRSGTIPKASLDAWSRQIKEIKNEDRDRSAFRFEPVAKHVLVTLQHVSNLSAWDGGAGQA